MQTRSVSAAPARARVAGGFRCSRRQMHINAKAESQTQTTTKTEQKDEAATQKGMGFKWDGSNLRWVRDDRFAGLPQMTQIQPKSGPAYTIWPVVHTTLKEAGLSSVTAREALELQEKGWTIVDVRIEGDYERQHIKGSVNLPLYRFVQGTELWDNIKKIAMMGFAMKATERDPDFGAKAAQQLKGQRLVVVCAIGGTLDTKLRLRPDKYKDGIADEDRSFGRESRSLKACYELLGAGWGAQDMVFMEGGFQQWRHQGLPLADDEE